MNVSRRLFAMLLGRRLPTTAGTVSVPGIERPVVIRRDAWGIPHIDVERDLDAWYGLGFCQGQDRTFQLEMLLRVVRGTLAALVGPDGLVVDRLARRIGFARAARQQLDVLDADIRATVEAFVHGINAGASRGRRRVSHELVLLRARRTPWTIVDALGLAKLQAFLLPANWDVELARLKMLTEDGPEALAALDPAYPESLPVTSPPGTVAGPALDRQIAQ